jgi:hypothetical protein
LFTYLPDEGQKKVLAKLRHLHFVSETKSLSKLASNKPTRWEHEHLLEAVQQRLDANPQAMCQRRETVEHPFGTMKARMGATHFLTKTLPKVAAEMALSIPPNLTRVINIVGIKPLMAAIGLRHTSVSYQTRRP